MSNDSPIHLITTMGASELRTAAVQLAEFATRKDAESGASARNTAELIEKLIKAADDYENWNDSYDHSYPSEILEIIDELREKHNCSDTSSTGETK